MAPEVILGMQYNQKADVFSYGIVLCEIITRRKISLDLQRSPADAFGMDVGKFKELIPRKGPPILEFINQSVFQGFRHKPVFKYLPNIENIGKFLKSNNHHYWCK